jgi:hypothetical protein
LLFFTFKSECCQCDNFITSPIRIPHVPSIQNQSVPGFGRSANDLVDNALFDDFPFCYPLVPVKLTDHGRVARIDRFRLDVVTDKIEKTGQLRKLGIWAFTHDVTMLAGMEIQFQ